MTKPFIRPAGCTDAIVLLVSLYCGIKVPEIVGDSRKRSVQHARMLAQFLIYTCTALSTTEVAEHFKLDHSTVVKNIKTVGRTAETDAELRAAIEALTTKARVQFSTLSTGALTAERPARRE